MMRVKRARGTRSWWGGPRPAPPAWGEVCIRPPRRASPTELNETAPRSKFSEIGHQTLQAEMLLAKHTRFACGTLPA